MLSTIASWAALLTLAAATTLYYNPDLIKKYLTQPAPQIPEEPKAAPKKRPKKTHTTRLDGDEQGTSTPTSSNEAPTSKKRKIVSPPINQTVKATTTSGEKASLPPDEDGGMTNKEFAEELARAQAGTNLEKKQQPSKKERRAQKAASNQKDANVSTDTASNADDDMSPIATPPSGANSTAATSRAGGVEDMLEPAASKATTMRITNVEQEKPKAAKEFQKVEKKQKQKSKKQLEEAAMKAEANRQQQQMQQTQMRSARVAEGSSKQTKANTFASTTKENAWKKPDEPKSPPQQATLLDTFDSAATLRAQPNGAVTAQPLANVTNGANKNVNALKKDQGAGKTEALAASGREGRPNMSRGESWADEVNDEEQNQWEQKLVEDGGEWESVTTKKNKKKTRNGDDSSEASASLARQPPKITAAQTNGTSRPEITNRFASVAVDDGEWEA